MEIDVMGKARYVRVVKSDLLDELSKDGGHLDDYNNPVIDDNGNVWM